MNSALRQIRSTAIAKANTLQRAARYLHGLRPAFAEWSAGEIYVCKKTGTYRYRFGHRSKSVTSWDALARQVFPSPAAFAFAAMVLDQQEEAAPESTVKVHGACRNERANVIAMAAAEREAA